MKEIPNPQSKTDLDKLLPAPGTDGYVFFEDIRSHPMVKTLEFRHENACWMLDCSYLSYSLDPQFCAGQLQNAGLNCRTFGFDRTEPPHALVANNDDFVIVAFRGTRIQEFPDILADIGFLPELTQNGLVHNGFQRALLAAGIWSEIQQYLHDISGDQVIIFTGHSLGAALATLARRTFRDTRGRQHALYTFGSPRVGDRVYCATYPTNDYRMVNDRDIVPHVPTPPIYGHVGTPYNPDGTLLEGSAWQQLEHSFAEVGSMLGVSSFRSGRDRLRQYFDSLPFKPIGDHAPKSYGAKLWNSLG